LKYTPRNEFKKGSYNAYSAALRQGNLEYLCTHMEKPQRKWGLKELKELTEKYSDRHEFLTKEPNAAASLIRKGKLEEYTIHMNRKRNKFHTITGKTVGVYFLYDNDEIVYIGKSKKLKHRLAIHLSDNKKEFSKVEIYEVPSLLDMHVLEVYMIAMHLPKYNKDINEESHVLTIAITDIASAISKVHVYEKTGYNTWNNIKEN